MTVAIYPLAARLDPPYSSAICSRINSKPCSAKISHRESKYIDRLIKKVSTQHHLAIINRDISATGKKNWRFVPRAYGRASEIGRNKGKASERTLLAEGAETLPANYLK